MAADPPDDVELEAFFECEASLLDPSVPWRRNTLTFQTKRDGIDVTCQLAPSYSTISVTLKVGEHEIAQADVHNFSSLEIDAAGGRETLIARFGEMDEATLWLSLRPKLRLAVAG